MGGFGGKLCIPALTLMFLLLLYLARIIRTGILLPNAGYALFVMMFVSLIKYTYMPFAAIFVAIAAVLYVQRYGFNINASEQKVASGSRNRAKLIAITIAIFLSSIAFAGTIGRNLIEYHAVNPDCSRSVEVCNQFEIFWRNHKQAALYKELVASGEVQPYRYTFFGHVGTWLDTYFISTYTYRGHVKDVKPISYVMTATLIAFVAGMLYMLFAVRKSSLQLSREQIFLMVCALLYVGVVYIFNVKTLYDFGTAYAYQGRYILLTTSILYIFLMMLIMRFMHEYRRSAQRNRIDFRLVIISICLVATVVFNPTVSLFMHTNSQQWFTDVAQRVIPESLQY